MATKKSSGGQTSDAPLVEFGNQVREARKKGNLSQTALGLVVDKVSQAEIVKLEKGEGGAAINTAWRLARLAFHLDLLDYDLLQRVCAAQDLVQDDVQAEIDRLRQANREKALRVTQWAYCPNHDCPAANFIPQRRTALVMPHRFDLSSQADRNGCCFCGSELVRRHECGHPVGEVGVFCEKCRMLYVLAPDEFRDRNPSDLPKLCEVRNGENARRLTQMLGVTTSSARSTAQ